MYITCRLCLISLFFLIIRICHGYTGSDIDSSPDFAHDRFTHSQLTRNFVMAHQNSAQSFSPHHRHHISKRTPATQFSFTLTQTGANAITTTLRVADTVTHVLTAQIVDSGTAEITVVFKMPVVDDGTGTTLPVFSICGLTVDSVGSDLDGIIASNIVGLETTGNDGRVEQLEIYLGEITRTGTNDQIIMHVEMVVLNHPAFINAEPFALTVNTLYGDGEAWSTTRSYNAQTSGVTLTSATSPLISISSVPTTIKLGTTHAWILGMSLDNAASDVIVSVTGSSTHLKVCRITVNGLGCFASEQGRFAYGQTENIATFNLGSVINKNFHQNESSTFEVEIDVTLLETATVNSQYSVDFSVEIDGIPNHSSTQTFTASEAVFTHNGDLPTFALSAAHDNVVFGEPTVFYLNITIPEGQSDTYYVEVALPVDDLPIMTTCPSEEFVTYYVGHNFPCFDGSAITFTTESTTSATEHDYIRMDLGVITNTGAGTGNDEDNTIVFAIRTHMVPSHSSVTDGQQVELAAGVRIGQDTIWVGEVAVTAVNDPVIGDEVPKIKVFSAMNERDANILYEGGITVQTVAVITPPGSIYRDITVTATSATLDSGPVLDICRIEMFQIGDSYQQDCLSTPWETTGSHVENRVLKSDTLVHSSATLTLTGTVINDAYGDFWWNANHTILFFHVIVSDATNPDVTDGDSLTFDLSLEYGGSAPVTKTVTLLYNSTLQPVLGDIDPQAEVAITEQYKTAWTHDVVTFDFTISTPPRSVLKYRMEALGANDTLSICRISVVNRGDKLSCFVNNYLHTHEYISFYGEYDNETCTTEDEENGICIADLHDFAALDLGKIANYNQNPGNSTANNFQIQMAVRFHEDRISDVSSGQTYPVTVGMFLGDERLWFSEVYVETESTPESLQQSGNPSFSMEKLIADNTLVTRGGGAVFLVHGHTQPLSTGVYNSKFVTPTDATTEPNKAYLGHVMLIDAGWNLPCLSDNQLTRSLIGDPLIHTVLVNIGTLSNQAYSEESVLDLQHEDNQFTLEVVVCIPENTTATNGDIMELSAAFQYDDGDIWTGASSYNVSYNIPNTEAVGMMTMEWSEVYSPLSVTPGVHNHRVVHIVTEVMTTSLELVFNLPTGAGSRLRASLANVQVSHVGRNYPCNLGREIEVQMDPTTTQDATLQVNFVVTNTGTTTRSNFHVYTPLDDVIAISYNVLVAQHEDNVDTPEIAYTVAITDTAGTFVTLNDEVVLDTSSTPVPEMQVLMWVGDSVDASQRQPGTTIQVFVKFSHTPQSTGHAFDATVSVYAPSYLQYEVHSGLDRHQSTLVSENTVVNADENSLNIQISEIYFPDITVLVVNYTIDPDATLINYGENVTASIMAGLVFSAKNLDRANVSGQHDVFETFSFDINIPECFDLLQVSNCQLTASSNRDGFGPEMSTINSSSGWSPVIRGSPLLEQEYLQIAFNNLTRVTGLSIQAAYDSDDVIVTFDLQYSKNGLLWSAALETEIDITALVSGYAANDVVYYPMEGSDAILARYLRIRPVSDAIATNAVFGLRVQAHGCALSEDSSVDSVCGATAAQAEMYQRGWLMDSQEGRLYVCIVRNLDSTEMSCSYTTDFGQHWKSIDEQVINIDFLRPDTQQLYGLAKNRMSRMRSDDWGENWCTVSDTEYSEAQSEDEIISVTRLPFEDWSGSTLQDLNTQFGFNFNSTFRWAVNSNGINVWDGSTWTLVTYWAMDNWA